MEGIGSLPYHDFRGFIEAAKKISEWRAIEGADWDGEIGALIEATAELDSRPMLRVRQDQRLSRRISTGQSCLRKLQKNRARIRHLA